MPPWVTAQTARSSTGPCGMKRSTRALAWLAGADGGRERQIAVVLDASPATQVWPLVTAAHQLSPRESDVTLLVARGLSTSEIGQSLRFTEHTVQEHLKVSSTSSASAAAVS